MRGLRRGEERWGNERMNESYKIEAPQLTLYLTKIPPHTNRNTGILEVGAIPYPHLRLFHPSPAATWFPFPLFSVFLP